MLKNLADMNEAEVNDLMNAAGILVRCGLPTDARFALVVSRPGDQVLHSTSSLDPIDRESAQRFLISLGAK